MSNKSSKKKSKMAAKISLIMKTL